MNTEKESRAIQYLKAFEPQTEPYYICYSGGKDSDAIRILAELAGVKHNIVHNLTTVDAPETVRYIKSIPRVIINRPPLSMWQLIVKHKVPPTRLMRYCCSDLKERYGKGNILVTGVRRAESASRRKNGGIVKIIGKPKKTLKMVNEIGADYTVTSRDGIILNNDNDESRRMVEMCYRTRKTMINPILDWSDSDVWDFLHYYGCKANPLYECGEKRIGCIGCPMQNYRKMKKDFEKYPKYKDAYIRAFDNMLAERKLSGMNTADNWTDGETVFRWWVGDNSTQSE